ncbi:MAG: hypothetical protein ACI9WU_005166 [Myxococcota bacterium]|jgi:hypothetical protein
MRGAPGLPPCPCPCPDQRGIRRAALDPALGAVCPLPIRVMRTRIDTIADQGGKSAVESLLSPDQGAIVQPLQDSSHIEDRCTLVGRAARDVVRPATVGLAALAVSLRDVQRDGNAARDRLHANGQVNADGDGQSTTALALASTALADTADSPSDWMPMAQAPDKAVELAQSAPPFQRR